VPPDATCPAWEPWKYATLEFSPLDSRRTAELVERLFLHFYDVPDDTELTTEIIDMG
jgi:hypothetical protein